MIITINQLITLYLQNTTEKLNEEEDKAIKAYFQEQGYDM